MNDLDNYACDFDCWTRTDRSKQWLMKNRATKLLSGWGFDFWENPIYGAEAPVLATLCESSLDASCVWNTQDFDLPVHDPFEKW